MKENIIDEMYMLAVKNKLQRGAISLEEKVNYIAEELKSLGAQAPIDRISAPAQNVVETASRESNVGGVGQSTVAAPAPSPAPSPAPKVEIEVRYAQNPDDAGFNNREMDFSSEACYYKIEIKKGTSDAEFSLLTENRVIEEYKMSPGIAPENVVKFENNPSEGSQLRVVKKGVLEKSGRFWVIITPCQMKWV